MVTQRPYILVQLEAYIHTQQVPMNEILIQHNKGKMSPKTVLTYPNGVEFEALVQSIDEDTIIVKMNQAVQFTAYIY